ncbi:restriction endonuclease [[Clostridium] fimetarium]|uniref:Restriction endonuclease n=1 Tax=[Clostridium] fimetarium TaxID=99656 RepID=A0A1I0M418_9FIRM|nr:restriction endonuclease [[Clostridium] fimetarium]SEV83083.1 Restriction endonuclease [[Clostridium] fimetarium]
MSKIILDYSDFYEDNYEFDKNGNKEKMNIISIKEPDSKKQFFRKRGFCPFCKIQIPDVYTNIYCRTMGVEMWSHIDIWECPECGWWEFYKRFSEEEDWIDKVVIKRWDTIRHAIIKKYDVSDKDLPIKALMKELEKRKDILYDIDPYKLEEVGQHVFSSYYNCEVKHVGKTGDGGVDLLLVKSDEPILVQVKRRQSPEHVELVSPIREFVGAMYLKNAKKGIFLSTAKSFSRGAKEIRKQVITERKFNYFELVNFEEFISMIDVTKTGIEKPWMGLVKEFEREKQGNT